MNFLKDIDCIFYKLIKDIVLYFYKLIKDIHCISKKILIIFYEFLKRY